MARSRVFQAGFEIGASPLNEMTAQFSASFTTNSAEKARTGGKSLKFASSLSNYVSKELGGLHTHVQLAFGVYVTNWQLSGSIKSPLVSGIEQIYSGRAFQLYKNASGLLYVDIYTATSTLTSYALSQNIAENAWYHVAIDAKLGASGWLNVYIDGVEALAYEGQVGNASSQLASLFFGKHYTTDRCPYMYMDDIYLDSMSGVVAPDFVADLRFIPVAIDGAGFGSPEWTPRAGDLNDGTLRGGGTNWEQVADPSDPDGDTTYVQADEADMVDVYEHAAVAIPENWRAVAFIPTVFARKTDAAVSSQISLFVDDGAGVTIDGAVQDLGVDYRIKWARFETGPAAAPWTQLLINQCQIGVKSEGVFV